MSMVEDWSSMILEWWGGMFFVFYGYFKYEFNSGTCTCFKFCEMVCLFTIMFGIASYSISPNIREGLLETFYGVYEKDPDKVDVCHKLCWIIIQVLYHIITFLTQLLTKWSLCSGIRFYKQWFKWEFLSPLEIWLLLEEQHNSSSTGIYKPI